MAGAAEDLIIAVNFAVNSAYGFGGISIRLRSLQCICFCIED